MSIYQDERKPYVYIIQHKDTGVKYVGAKWAKDANPDNFMQINGYQTSSNTVKDVLDNTQGVVFSIIDIIDEDELKMPFGCQTVYEYESWFIEENNCRSSPDWYNKMPPWMIDVGSNEFKQMMMEKHGVENCSGLPWVREKAANTLFERTGYHHSLQNPDSMEKLKSTNMSIRGVEFSQQDPVVRENTKHTNLEKYGFEYTLQSEIVKALSRETNLKNTGFEYPMQNPDTQQKSILKLKSNYGDQYTNPSQVPEIQLKKMKTTLETRGVEYPSQDPNVKEKVVATNLSRTGYSSPLKNPAIRKKGEDTNILKYGVPHALQSKEISNRVKISREKNTILKYGVEHTGKVKWTCGQCNCDGVNLSNFTRYHGNHEEAYIIILGEKVKHGN